MITELLKEMLEALGYEPIVCNQGDAALQALDKWRFDVVMSDFRMPGMDGRSFYKEVTARKPEMSGRFIFLTGDTCNSDTLDFVESVGARCLGKPFHLEAMDKTLTEVLSQPLAKAA
jgi:DNA-binding response OmpR family regulator